MKYLSVCSGIEAATVAWHPIGWEPVAFAEIEKFQSAVLAHHYPDVPNLGDMTDHEQWPDLRPDLIVGGTPCQSFSVAGLRKGVADPRGNLALTFLAIVDQYRPAWVVWENVPGVLSSNEGRDFGAFLGGLGELGYGFAYRVLDAQYVRTQSHPRAVPQRRRRVFVVGYSGDWRPPAAVLFESESLCGHPAPRRETREGNTADVSKSIRGNSGGIDREDMHTLICMASGSANAEITENLSPTITCLHDGPPIAFQQNTRDKVRMIGGDRQLAGALAAEPGMKQQNYVASNRQVRRLTPVECEFLQGFSRDYTQVPYRNKPACDGQRYKALGNSMAVNVMNWLGGRINQVNEITNED